MRVLCLIGLAALLAAPASLSAADAARERKVKVALALAEAAPAKTDDARAAKVAAALERAGIPSPAPFAPVPAIAPAPMPREVVLRTCDCDSTGSCKCPPGACGCCDRPLPDYPTQCRRAAAAGKPVVVFVGCRGRCLDGAFAAECKLGEHGNASPAPCVEVHYPTPAGFRFAFRLPADAAASAVKAAVGSAAKAVAAEQKAPPAPAKVSLAPVRYWLPAAFPVCVGQA